MKKLFIVLTLLMIVCTSACEDKNSIDYKIKKMSLKDKVSQILMPSLRFIKYETVLVDGKETTEEIDLEVLDENFTELLKEYKFGGVILFSENLHTSKNSYELIKDIKKAHGEDEIPLFIGVDQEGGQVKRLSYGTTMPGNMALCASNNPENAYEATRIIGSELKLLGFNLNFSPVVDINSNPANPIIAVRSFSDDSDYAKEYIEKSIQGYHDEGLLVSLKHFPGHGDTSVDSHTGLPLVEKTYEEIINKELKTFEYGINAGADMIMSAHIQFPNIDDTQYTTSDGKKVYLPATLSSKMMSILRDDLKYEGLICSDSLAMDAIAKFFDPKDVATLCINAGVDMLLMPVDYKQSEDAYISQVKDYVDMIISLVEEGKIDEKRIDESVRRILLLKEKINNKENEVSDYTTLIGSKDNHDKELEIAKKCITLIENNIDLPLNKDNKTLILVPYASQGGSVKYAKQILLEENLIDDESLNYYVFSDDNSDSFDYKMIDEYYNIVLVSAMYGFEDISDEYSKIIDKVLDLCRKSNKKSILISAHLPYDLSRFEADTKIATYLGAGVSTIPTDFNNDVQTYAPNLLSSFIHLYEDSNYSGRLPVDIPELEYDETNNVYSPSDKIRYQRGYGLD